MNEWRLRIGTKLTGYTVVSDDTYASRWRVHATDGRISDMVNLTRAKDAARSWALQGRVGGFGSLPVRWECNETPQRAAPMRYSGLPGVP
jgi:hypothetical protein